MSDDQPTRRWYRFSLKTLLLAQASLVLVVAVFCCVGPVKTWYLARGVTSAQTPEEEVEACRLMNHWEYGYSVWAFDASGAEVRPTKTGDWDRVDSVKIEFRDGTTVRRKILDRNSLSYIYGD